MRRPDKPARRRGRDPSLALRMTRQTGVPLPIVGALHEAPAVPVSAVGAEQSLERHAFLARRDALGGPCFPLRGKWPTADRGGSAFPSGYRFFAQKKGQKDPFGPSASVLGVSSIKPFLLSREQLRHAALSPLEIHKVFPAGSALPDPILPRQKVEAPYGRSA